MRCLSLLFFVLTSTLSITAASLQPQDRMRPGPQSSIDNAVIRGVPSTKTSLYDPSRKDFECLDGSKTIPFTQVNDDYCDCDDSSDEPGTSACPNGYFYCQNLGYKGYFVPTGWINDNICDCCDGSDEYGGEVFCQDTCIQLAQEEYKKYLEIEQVYKQGVKIREQLIETGKKLRVENQEKLSKLRADLAEAERIKKEREVIKTQTEEREKVALEKYKPEPQPEEATVAAEEAKLAGEEEKELEVYEAQDYFKTLDSDSSGTVTVSELQTRVIFDKDRNGEVSQEEALFFLNNKEEVTEQEFIESAWANIKPFIMLNKGLFKPAESLESEEEILEEGHSDDEGLDEELETEPVDAAAEEREITEEQAELDREAEHDKEEDKPQEPIQPQYDEETLAIIEEAKEARTKYQEAENSVLELTRETRKYEERMERDYGPQDEYASLDEQCYEYQTQEYVYSLCLFGRATQRAVSGGSEVSLGQWNSWTGGEGDQKYTAAKYDRGLTCWNGPSRSTLVTIKCGVEAAITSVSEPNRCEYAMELLTPAACNINLLDKKNSFDDNLKTEHDEL